MNDKCFLNKLLMFICIGLFIYFTVCNLINHFPWLDEALAWNISKNMSFQNVLPTLKREGHFIIWYLLLMPFAKGNLFYPYSMIGINWLAYLAAMIVMWRRAPFSNWIKIFVTFSWMSLNFHPIVARCYSIGILGLFILASLYKQQTKRPYLYSIMLVLTAHTSLVAALPVVPLFCIFVYNLFKNRKDLSARSIFYPSVILFLGIYLWFLPFLNGYGPDNFSYPKGNFISLIKFFKLKYFWPLICYLVSMLGVLLFADNKVRFFTIVTVGEFSIFFSTVYMPTPHHCTFLIIFLILFIWLVPEFYKINYKNFIFIIPFLCLLVWNHDYHLNYILKNPDKTELIKYIKEQNKKGLLLVDLKTADITPYLYDYRYILADDKIMNDNLKLKNHIINCFNLDKSNDRLYLITDHAINGNSKIFTRETKELYGYPKSLYITILDRGGK